MKSVLWSILIVFLLFRWRAQSHRSLHGVAACVWKAELEVHVTRWGPSCAEPACSKLLWNIHYTSIHSLRWTLQYMIHAGSYGRFHLRETNCSWACLLFQSRLVNLVVSLQCVNVVARQREISPIGCVITRYSSHCYCWCVLSGVCFTRPDPTNLVTIGCCNSYARLTVVFFAGKIICASDKRLISLGMVDSLSLFHSLILFNISWPISKYLSG